MIVITMLGVIVLAHDKSALASNPTEFVLGVSKERMSVGEQVLVTINGRHLNKLYGFEIKLDYDANKLKFEGITSTLTGFKVEPKVTDNQIIYAFTKTGDDQGISGDHELGSFRFISTLEGVAKVRLVEISLMNQ
ncbi:hypothetical protein D3C73_861710 [compost metagenome]